MIYNGVEYRPVVGHPRYLVGADGSVIGPSGKTLKQGVDTYGYPQIGISCGSRDRHLTRKVHRLVLEAFVGPSPSPKHQAAHWDGNMLNNAVSNLRWATAKENIADKVRHGRVTRTSGEVDGMSKLTTDQVIEIRWRLAAGASQHQLAEEYGVKQATISNIHTRTTWRHL